jgi:hypothetical protein
MVTFIDNVTEFLDTAYRLSFLFFDYFEKKKDKTF